MTKTRLFLLVSALALAPLGFAQQPRASADDGLRPVRTVASNVISSEHSPAVRITIDPKFAYAGGKRFILYGVAEAEIHVFAELDADKKLQRLYWVQFEGYLPSNRHTYRYKSPRKMAVGGLEFILDTNVAAGVSARAPRDGSDQEAVNELLKAAGWAFPDDVLSARLVHMTDSSNRNELMIIYAESAAAAGASVADLVDGSGKPSTKWTEEERAFLARAVSGLKIDPLK